MTPKKPTHLLKVKERDGNHKGTIGVGWLNNDGSISIALNPCTCIQWTDDVTINLFPVEFKETT